MTGLVSTVKGIGRPEDDGPDHRLPRRRHDRPRDGSAPRSRPPKIWAVGYAYGDHRTVFLKALSSVIGTGERIRSPKTAPDAVDHEGELAVARDVQKGRIPGRAADVTAAKELRHLHPRGARPGHDRRLTTRFRQATEDMTT